jgi:hypothetical protein
MKRWDVQHFLDVVAPSKALLIAVGLITFIGRAFNKRYKGFSK